MVSLVLGYLNKLVIEMAFLIQVKQSNFHNIYIYSDSIRVRHEQMKSELGRVLVAVLLLGGTKLSISLCITQKANFAGQHRRGAPRSPSWNMSN